MANLTKSYEKACLGLKNVMWRSGKKCEFLITFAYYEVRAVEYPQ